MSQLSQFSGLEQIHWKYESKLNGILLTLKKNGNFFPQNPTLKNSGSRRCWSMILSYKEASIIQESTGEDLIISSHLSASLLIEEVISSLQRRTSFQFSLQKKRLDSLSMLYGRDQQIYSVNSQRRTILGFSGHMVPVTTTQFCEAHRQQFADPCFKGSTVLLHVLTRENESYEHKSIEEILSPQLNRN